MKNRIVTFNLIILTLSMLVIFFSGISINKSSHYEEAKREIKSITEIYATNYSPDIAKDVPDGIRLTVIDDTFKVISDSEDANIVGTYHTNRGELESALNGTPETVVRYSSTLGKDMVYYALKTNTADSYVFVRTAIPVESVNGYVKNSIPSMICVFAIALFISYIASIIATNGLIRPIKDVKSTLEAVRRGSYREVVPSSYDKEINSMLSEINTISSELRMNIAEAKEKKESLYYVLSNISDGIIVLNEDRTVNLMNNRACEIFGLRDVCGKDVSVLTADRNFVSEISKVSKNMPEVSFETESDGCIYMTSAHMVDRGFIIIVLTDITAVKNAEKMRSEFFANASHELKTPLTAIKGFNDMISMQSKEETTVEFSRKIDREVSRIINLINDMLNLSKLETEEKGKCEEINLSDIVTQVTDSLGIFAKERGVNLESNGTATTAIEKEHAIELIKNLVENGIRYNNPGGYVKTYISENNREVTLSVSDNGIGIAEEDIHRIFERFYRVNKSRSRETGGTGLGLSIVKHICTLYNASLSVDSKLGVGTKITVTFPKTDISEIFGVFKE